MAVKNSTILEQIWLEGSNSYQQRLDPPSQVGLAAHVEQLFAPMNNDLFNEFSSLLNGIMSTYVYQRRFDNPYREIKKDPRRFGASERAVTVNYMQAHAFKFDDETLLKTERPEYVEWFYSTNYKVRYEFSWNRVELQQAFAEDGYGFNDLLAATLDAQMSSDNYDEMNTMLQVFAEADARFENGLYRHQVSNDFSTLEARKKVAMEILEAARMYANRLKFPSVYYNALPVPVHETPETLILWIQADIEAYISVDALATLFNIDRAEVRYRTFIVPEFPIPGVYAAITSEDFIWWRDVEYGVYDFWNPSKLEQKYYLHHWARVGANPAANCILIGDFESTNRPTVTVAPSGLTFEPAAYNVTLGGSVKTFIKLDGTVTGDELGKIGVKPDAATYVVTAEGKALNTRTYVDARGVLHVQKSGLEVGDELTITATSTYTNPSGETTEYTATATATIVAPEPAEYCSVETDPYIEYTDTTVEASASE